MSVAEARTVSVMVNDAMSVRTAVEYTVVLTCSVLTDVEERSSVVVFQNFGFAVSVTVMNCTEVGSPQVATGILLLLIKLWHSLVDLAGSLLQEPAGSLHAGRPGSRPPPGIAIADATRARVAMKDFILNE